MRGSSESDYVTARAAESERGAPLLFIEFVSTEWERRRGDGERGQQRGSEEQIERSKLHWSLLADQSDGMSDNDEVAEQSNVRIFQTLQLHPTWGKFFFSFGEDGMSMMGEWDGGELRVGEKFAEGGQAELFHAHVTWRNPKSNDWHLEDGTYGN